PGKSVPSPLQANAAAAWFAWTVPSRPRRTGTTVPVAAPVCCMNSFSTRMKLPAANPVAEVTLIVEAVGAQAALSVVDVKAMVSLLTPDPARPVGPEFFEAIQRVDARHLLVALRAVLLDVAQRDVQFVVTDARDGGAIKVGVEVRHRENERLGMEDE